MTTYTCELEVETDESFDGCVKNNMLFIKHDIEAETAIEAAEKFRIVHGYTPDHATEFTNEIGKIVYFNECEECNKMFLEGDGNLIVNEESTDNFSLICKSCLEK